MRHMVVGHKTTKVGILYPINGAVMKDCMQGSYKCLNTNTQHMVTVSRKLLLNDANPVSSTKQAVFLGKE